MYRTRLPEECPSIGLETLEYLTKTLPLSGIACGAVKSQFPQSSHVSNSGPCGQLSTKTFRWLWRISPTIHLDRSPAVCEDARHDTHCEQPAERHPQPYGWWRLLPADCEISINEVWSTAWVGICCAAHACEVDGSRGAPCDVPRSLEGRDSYFYASCDYSWAEVY